MITLGQVFEIMRTGPRSSPGMTSPLRTTPRRGSGMKGLEDVDDRSYDIKMAKEERAEQAERSARTVNDIRDWKKGQEGDSNVNARNLKRLLKIRKKIDNEKIDNRISKSLDYNRQDVDIDDGGTFHRDIVRALTRDI